MKVKVVDYYQTPKKNLMDQSVTFFTIETISTKHSHLNISKDKKYKVNRRFNDFKSLHENLSQNPDYIGHNIPALP